MRGPTRTRARGMGGNRSHYSHPGAVVVERLGELLRVGCQQLLRVGNSLELHSGVGQRGREERRGEDMGRAARQAGRSEEQTAKSAAGPPQMRSAALPRAVAVLSVPRRTEPKQNAAAGGIGSGSQAAKRVFGRAARPATVWSPHTIAVSISARLAPRIFESVVFSFPLPLFGAARPQAAWATGHRAASDVCRRAAPAGPGAHTLLICVPCRAGTAGHAGPAMTSTPRTRCTQSQPTSGCILVVGGHTYDYEEGGAWGE